MLAWTGTVATIGRRLRTMGYSGVELMMRDADAVDLPSLLNTLGTEELSVPAIGLGPAAQEDGLTLTDADAAVRAAARRRLAQFVRFAGRVSAQVNLGRMRGQLPDGPDREQAYAWAVAALQEAAALAADLGTTVLIEPQGRPMTNFVNTLQEAVGLAADVGAPNVRVLADAYYLFTEEVAPIPALIRAWPHVGHLHLADAGRRSLGWGSLPWPVFVETALALGYQGFLTVEVQQDPSPEAAAQQAYERCTAVIKDALVKAG